VLAEATPTIVNKLKFEGRSREFNGGSLQKSATAVRNANPKEDYKVEVNGSNLRWCAVQVRPRYEVPVAASLRGKGYQEFLPLHKVRRQWSDRSKVLKVPLFTGYVFCRFDPQIPWTIVSTPGVIRIVGTKKEIAVIDDREIEAIQIVAGSGEKVEPCAYAGTGDRVRIMNGPLAGVEGIVTGCTNQRRLVLSVDLIQSAVSVEVDGCDMQLISKAPSAVLRDSSAPFPAQLSLAATAGSNHAA
jgi:transcription antitermination factor NusG